MAIKSILVATKMDLGYFKLQTVQSSKQIFENINRYAILILILWDLEIVVNTGFLFFRIKKEPTDMSWCGQLLP